MNLSNVRKPIVRPRSPEAKPLRARSPIMAKQAGTTFRPAGVFGASSSMAAPAPASLAGRGSPQQQQFGQAPKRGSSSTVEEIKKIDVNREQRRRAAEEVRRTREEESEALRAQCGGRAPDIDFHRMIRDFRQQCPQPAVQEPMDPSADDGIVVCVRKRPMQTHESANRELDCITALNPYAIVHERKFKVDGITKCLESHSFEFDRVFAEDKSQEHVYSMMGAPLVPWVFSAGGRATLFAYGQTGSGKTHTMTGIQAQMAAHIFEELSDYSNSRQGQTEPLAVSVSFFEIYGGRPFDLLNNRQRLETLEDSRNEVQIAGLTERGVTSPAEMLALIDLGNSLRTTHATAINRDSSRSHAVCSIFLRRQPGEIHGKWTLVDLAGSERAADSKSSIRQRRVEGAQINKSLLALKECIRAMNTREAHVPFRASKLTLVLRDAFITRGPSKTVMIACISPGMSSADHSVNTLRYSDRLKDHPKARGAGASSEDMGDSNRPRVGVTTTVMPGQGRGPSPDGRSRLRSPSPTGAAADAGRARGASGASAGALHPKEHTLEGDYIDDEELSEDEETPAAEDTPVSGFAGVPQVQPAWPEAVSASGASADCAASSEPARASASASAVAAGTAARQLVPRRGRQPTLGSGSRGAQAMAPNRPDALGSRADHGGSGPSRAAADPGGSAPSRGSAPVVPQIPQLPLQQPPAAAPSSEQPRSADRNGAAANGPTGAAVGAAGSERAAARSPRATRERSPKRSEQSGDLLQQDNRYLHNTLTSEVLHAEAQRQRQTSETATGIVDVGVEDLTDLAHMEALDEVRQWEDRIVSQHMVALQEDARLLTVESELLSQVQQGASYDIDWYVSEVDKVVRRKMEVYAGFLDELEVFKAQLRREETLSKSCQRNRPPGSGLAGEGSAPSPRALAREIGESTPQRTPRTPRAKD